MIEVTSGKLSQNAIVLFQRNGKGKTRVGRVISSCRANSKKVKVTVPEMASNTTIPTDQELFEIKVLVTKEVLDLLNTVVEDDDQVAAA